LPLSGLWTRDGRYAIAREGEARARQGGSGRFGSAQTCTEPAFGKSRDEAAKKFGVSPRTVSSAASYSSARRRVAIAEALRAEMGERRGGDYGNQYTGGKVQDFAPSHDGRKTREIVAEKAGFGNAETYRQANLKEKQCRLRKNLSN